MNDTWRQANLVDPSQYRLMPWKNGKGYTTEVYASRDSITDELLWRFSMATVNTNGEFSDFTGYQRTLVMLSGNGMTLTHNNQITQTLKAPYDYCTFDGGWSTNATLIDGPIIDFNIIHHAQRTSAEVSIYSDGETHELKSSADEVYLFSHRGVTHCSRSRTASDAWQIPEGHLLYFANPTSGVIRLSGKGLIAIGISHSK